MPRFFLLVFSLFIASSQLLADNASSLSVIDKQITANSTALETFLNAESASDYRSALEQFKSLHKSDPTNAELSFYLGRSLYHQGEFEAADEVLSKNIENHPRHYESHYVLGSVKLSRVSEVNLFRKASMAKAAIAAWEKTVELKPDHVEAL